MDDEKRKEITNKLLAAADGDITLKLEYKEGLGGLFLNFSGSLNNLIFVLAALGIQKEEFREVLTKAHILTNEFQQSELFKKPCDN